MASSVTNASSRASTSLLLSRAAKTSSPPQAGSRSVSFAGCPGLTSSFSSTSASMGTVPPLQQFWKILLPAALPTVFVGMRLGLVFAMINIVGVEFLINFGGLGQLVNELAERYDMPGTYGAILFVVLTSIVFFDVTERLEQWLRPHR